MKLPLISEIIIIITYMDPGHGVHIYEVLLHKHVLYYNIVFIRMLNLNQ